MATAPPPQRQSVLDERSTTGLTLRDLLEMTPNEIEAHLRATAPQREPAVLKPGRPDPEPTWTIGPMNPPRDILGEAMAEGSPPVPWVAGYALAAGASLETAHELDTLAGILGQVMEAKAAKGTASSSAVARVPRPARLRGKLFDPQGKSGPVFYSQARAVIEDPKTQGTQTGEAWTKFLTDPKRGVKAEEMKYTRLGDFLKERSGQRVTRDEILKHLDANEIGVQEVTKGAPHEVAWEPDTEFPGEVFHGKAPDAKASRYVVMRERGGPNAGKWTLSDSADTRVKGVFDTPEAAQRAATYALGMERSGQPKFSQYTLPGATNYREVLLTLPVSAAKELPPGYRAQQIEAGPQSGMWEVITPTGHRTGFAARTREEAIADASVGTTTQLSLERSDTFRSGHWDEPNVLAHLRLSDREDADGKRVLLVEEIQSDWGQKGRREGFAPKNQADLVAAAKAKQEAFSAYRQELIAKHGPAFWGRLSPEELARYDALNEGTNNPKPLVADAPFITDTAKWTTLGLKRILRMAADEGYDRIGIVRGQEQAERYDLSKQIDELKWYRDGDKYRITAMKDGRPVVKKGDLSKNELAENVGKELADKIIAGSAEEQNGTFSGLDLKVGGEGMKGYYDKIVPETLNKLAKEYGVKVKLEGGKVKTPGAETPIHTLDVPEPMKKSIKTKGFPLYSKQENLGTLMRNA